MILLITYYDFRIHMETDQCTTFGFRIPAFYFISNTNFSVHDKVTFTGLLLVISEQKSTYSLSYSCVKIFQA